MIEIWTINMWNGSIAILNAFAGFNEKEANDILQRNFDLFGDNSTRDMPLTIQKSFEIPEDLFIAKAKELINGI